MRIICFPRSFLTFWVHDPDNVARIQLDAACELLDEESGRRDTFYLVTPCKAEHMYLEQGLFKDPNYDFCGVWSRGQYLILRTFASAERDQRESGRSRDRFTDVRLTLTHYAYSEALEREQRVVESVLAGTALVARTELLADGSTLRATLQYPLKTINVDPTAQRFQVDTGPLLLPDLSASLETAIEHFARAFIAYNTFDRAEFVVQVPTPLDPRQPEGPAAAHYSRLVSMAARHEIFAVADQPPVTS
jgi:hypothetical protein